MTGAFALTDLAELFSDPRGGRRFAFTDEQAAAITAPLEPGVVIAGAGSGKTTVMAARVVWLVATGAVTPDQVLGLTFTNKAAGELARRVQRALAALAEHLEHHGSGASLDAGATVLTYHAYAGRLLQEHGLRVGLEPGARLLADATRYQLAEHVVRRAEGPFPGLEGTMARLVGQLVDLDGELSEHLVEPERLAAFDTGVVAQIEALPSPVKPVREVAARARARLDLVQLVQQLRAEKQRRTVLDFGDQMAGAARLAESVPAVVEVERGRFAVVLLDEYQDTSVTQKRLLLALFGGGHPVTAVGDPFQAIYGWRGASVGNIDRFPEEFVRGPAPDAPPAHHFSLGQNNRSGGRLLAFANALAAPLRDVHPNVVELRPPPAAEQAGTLRVGLFASHPQEVAWVADDVARSVGQGVAPRDIAILARQRRDLAPLHAALTERGVPVEVVGLGGLLAMPEVVDLVAMLQAVDDPTANPALVRVLTGPRWRIGPRDLALLGRRARALVATDGQLTRPENPGGLDLEDALLAAVAGIDPTEVVSLSDAVADPGALAYSPEALERFALLADELAQLRRGAGQPLVDVVHQVITTMGIDVEVSAAPEARTARRAANLDSFVEQAAAFVDIDETASLGAFLAFLAASESYERGLDAGAPTPSDSVKLMTVHKAKGLEWSVVYLPALAARAFPSEKGTSRWVTNPAALPYPLRGDHASYPDIDDWTTPGLAAFKAAAQEIERREELRLGYVAVTRPKAMLVMTASWWGPTQKQPRGPSEFLAQAHRHVLETGVGEVVRWEPAPADDAQNPLLDAGRTVPWPVPPDDAAEERRQSAVAAVRAALQRGPAEHTVRPADLTPQEVAVVSAWDRDLEMLLAEARRAADPVREVPFPESLTASQVVRLAAEPEGFARDLARPLPRPPAPAAQRGTDFHAWVEARFTRPALLDLDDLDAADADLAGSDLTALQTAFLAGPYADRTPFAVEAPFAVVLGDHTVRGRIDAVYRSVEAPAEAARYQVVDWKTGRSPADPLQLAVYRLAWAELHGIRLDQVDAVFYQVPTGEVVRPEGLPGRDELIALLSARGPAPGTDSGTDPATYAPAS